MSLGTFLFGNWRIQDSILCLCDSWSRALYSSASIPSYTVNPLIDDLCSEENASDLFLSVSVPVNDQSGKWKLFYIFIFQAGNWSGSSLGGRKKECYSEVRKLHEPHPCHTVLPHLLLKEPFTAVLIAEGTSRDWRNMVFFPSRSLVSYSEPLIC